MAQINRPSYLVSMPDPVSMSSEDRINLLAKYPAIFNVLRSQMYADIDGKNRRDAQK